MIFELADLKRLCIGVDQLLRQVELGSVGFRAFRGRGIVEAIVVTMIPSRLVSGFT